MPYPEVGPNSGQGYGPSEHPVGFYHGEQVYAEWYEFGNYWIAYVLSQDFIGAGMSPGLARGDFVRTADLVLGST